MEILKIILLVLYTTGFAFNLGYIIFFNLFRDIKIRRNLLTSYILFPLGSYFSWLVVYLIVENETKHWRKN